MTDSRFKWLISAVCLTAIVIAVIVTTLPIALKSHSEAAQTREKTSGAYLYIDGVNIAHTSRKCKFLKHGYMRVKKSEFELSKFAGICPTCVTDDEYEKITDKTK
jgi:hypothetical protein